MDYDDMVTWCFLIVYVFTNTLCNWQYFRVNWSKFSINVSPLSFCIGSAGASLRVIWCLSCGWSIFKYIDALVLVSTRKIRFWWLDDWVRVSSLHLGDVLKMFSIPSSCLFTLLLSVITCETMLFHEYCSCGIDSSCASQPAVSELAVLMWV